MHVVLFYFILCFFTECACCGIAGRHDATSVEEVLAGYSCQGLRQHLQAEAALLEQRPGMQACRSVPREFVQSGMHHLNHVSNVFNINISLQLASICSCLPPAFASSFP
jgi:hypothetical protein